MTNLDFRDLAKAIANGSPEERAATIADAAWRHLHNRHQLGQLVEHLDGTTDPTTRTASTHGETNT